MERTLVLLKPDAIQRHLVGPIITRIEGKGLKIVAMKLMNVTQELASKHYSEHIGKPFYEGLVEFITSGPIVALVLEGNEAVRIVRTLMGLTNPADAAPGTIRGDLAMTIGSNLIHGSDSVNSSTKEIDLFFTVEDILEYEKNVDEWITGV